MEGLLFFWAVVWICKNAFEDAAYAVKGKPSPRRVRQLKRLEQSGGTPRYGLGGFVRDFADDFLQARTEKRREVAAGRKRAVAAAGEAKADRRTEQSKTGPKPVATFTPQAVGPRRGDRIIWNDDPENPVEVVADGEEVPDHELAPELTRPSWSTRVRYSNGEEHIWLLQPQDYTVVPNASRRVDPLHLDGRDKHEPKKPPKVGQLWIDSVTHARYRWDGGAWVKTHNADGSEIPLCPSCGRRRYKAVGDGCGNCRPITQATVRRATSDDDEPLRVPVEAVRPARPEPRSGYGEGGYDADHPPTALAEAVASKIRNRPPFCRTCQQDMVPVTQTPNGDTTRVAFVCRTCTDRKTVDYRPGLAPPEPVPASPEEDRQQTTPTPVAPVIPIFGTNPNHQEEPMSDTAEVTGLTTAITYAEQVAEAHEAHATDADQFAASLAGNGVGDGTVGLVGQAMEASNSAAEAWRAVRDALNEQMGVREAYDAAPDAGDKEFVTAE